MGLFDFFKNKSVIDSKNMKQSRTIAAKLNDTHIKYASDKTSGEELIKAFSNLKLIK